MPILRAVYFADVGYIQLWAVVVEAGPHRLVHNMDSRMDMDMDKGRIRSQTRSANHGHGEHRARIRDGPHPRRHLAEGVRLWSRRPW